MIGRLIAIRSKILRNNADKRTKKNISAEETMTFMEGLTEPKNSIERSFTQYCCQRKRTSSFLCNIGYCFMNLVSLLILIVLFLLPSNVYKNKSKNYGSAVCVASEQIKARMPKSVFEMYPDIKFAIDNTICITNREKQFIWEIWKKYFLSTSFVLKIFLKVALYNNVINEGYTKYIFASSEYSYTSSALTYYCHIRNVKHINFMHGEIWLDLVRTYFEFDQFYVWDKYYIDLCCHYLKATVGEYIIERPPHLEFHKSNIKEGVKYKYFLQTFNKQDLLKIRDSLDSLKEPYKVRPHPLYGNKKLIQDVFSNEQIELTDSVDIEQSIMESQYIIARDSTVLYQALLNGKIPVIDDVTYKKRYVQLKKDMHIMAYAEHMVLSNLLDMKRSADDK